MQIEAIKPWKFWLVSFGVSCLCGFGNFWILCFGIYGFVKMCKHLHTASNSPGSPKAADIVPIAFMTRIFK